ncbi:unnamed protein product, partial [Mesorhabditis belari]|uniref:Choline transporter-like protein n=1 Tax=Mesorhabditis belari TaxID=2138241 RepID=A0AAF3ETJ1_9BILA
MVRRVHPSAPPVELYSSDFHHHPPSNHRPDHHFPNPGPHSPPPSYPGSIMVTHGRTHFVQDHDSIYNEISDGENDGIADEQGIIPVITPDRAARFNPKTINPKKRHKRRKSNPMYYTKRGCTDVACCFLFTLFIGGWAFIAVFGFMFGNPERLIHPVDSLGRRCGFNRKGGYDLTSKPYLFFFDLTTCISYSTLLAGCQTPQVCVSQCPTAVFSYLELQQYGDGSNAFIANVQQKMICQDTFDKATLVSYNLVKAAVNNGSCAKYTIPSAPVLGRCLPQFLIGAVNSLNDLQSANGSLSQLINQFGNDGGSIPNATLLNDTGNIVGNLVGSEGVLTKIAADLSNSWWQILTMIIVAGVLAFLWTVVMRIFGSLMIWSSIGLIVAGLSVGCGYCWIKWQGLRSSGATDDFSFQPMFNLYFEMPTTWLVFAIGGSIILLIVVLILLCVASRIRLGVAMIEESSKAVAHMMSTLLFPLFPFILHVLVFIMWGSIAIWLASTGDENCRKQGATGNETMNNPSCPCETLGVDPTCVYVNVTRNNERIFWFQAYNLFAFFWLTCFVSALGDIALAGAFASHYWAVDKNKDLPTFPVLRALTFAIKYNLGSLAFGSLIIAIVKFIRVILDYLDKKAEVTQNQALKWILTCLKCCFWCLEAILKFLTKNAYIMMAIYGRNFFTSAKDSFMLLTRNCIRVVVINKVTSFLLFIGKATITIGMGVIAFYWFSGKWVINGIPQVQLYYYFVPIIIVLIGSYFIADLFFDVYDMAVDTTFICFLEDSEQNDGSPEKPYFMTPNLLKILGKKNEPTKA